MKVVGVVTSPESNQHWVNNYGTARLFNFDLKYSLIEAYDSLLHSFGDEDILIYLHDDVEVYEPLWGERITAEFADPKVVIVGMGGATGIGVNDIYKVPYDITQLQRINYHSNQRDAEIHGQRFTGSMDVAVVDGFCMAVRVEWLKRIGGWKTIKTNFHLYDEWLCLLAIRAELKVRMVGIDCLHKGGGASTKQPYMDWCLNHATTPEREHSEPHVRFYEEFRDLMPYRISL